MTSTMSINSIDNSTIDVARRRLPMEMLSVLQYLDDTDATKAIGTLATACRRLLLFDAPTISDRDTVIDPSSTDLDVHWRTGDWYADA